MLSININLLFNVINILVLVVLVRLFLIKPVKKILAERQALVQHSFDEAEAVKTKAAQLEQQYRGSIQGIEDEKLALITEAQKKAAEESELLVQSARERASSIIKNAETEAAGRKGEMLRQTKEEITEIIVAATARVSGVGGGSTLYDEFLKKAGVSDGSSEK
jgi:F-type H+-transporting ATPase subunit b